MTRIVVISRIYVSSVTPPYFFVDVILGVKVKSSSWNSYAYGFFKASVFVHKLSITHLVAIIKLWSGVTLMIIAVIEGGAKSPITPQPQQSYVVGTVLATHKLSPEIKYLNLKKTKTLCCLLLRDS